MKTIAQDSILETINLITIRLNYNILVLFLPNEQIQYWKVDRFDGSNRSSVASVEFNTISGICLNEIFNNYNVGDYLGNEKQFLSIFQKRLEELESMKVNYKFSNNIPYVFYSNAF